MAIWNKVKQVFGRKLSAKETHNRALQLDNPKPSASPNRKATTTPKKKGASTKATTARKKTATTSKARTGRKSTQTQAPHDSPASVQDLNNIQTLHQQLLQDLTLIDQAQLFASTTTLSTAEQDKLHADFDRMMQRLRDLLDLLNAENQDYECAENKAVSVERPATSILPNLPILSPALSTLFTNVVHAALYYHLHKTYLSKFKLGATETSATKPEDVNLRTTWSAWIQDSMWDVVKVYGWDVVKFALQNVQMRGARN